jgi:3-methyladenine DNA glycosylase Tag
MRTFEEIFTIAADRKGNLDDRLSEMDLPKSNSQLAAIPDDRWLSCMTRYVFNAGFNWHVVKNMWPGFEEAFEGFDVGYCSMLNDEDLGRLVSDKRIVRYGQKIRAVQQNAEFVNQLFAEYGGAGVFFGEWPSNNYVGLLSLIKQRGSRLGGNTGQYFLRTMGVDSFILSYDVSARLVAEGVVDKVSFSKKSMEAIQTAFNAWHEQSGRSLKEISRVLAYSIG